MSLRGADTLAEQVAELIRENQELKTAQFTSQNSGMKFKQADDLTGEIPVIVNTGYGDGVVIITNTFTPDHDRPAICIPHISYYPMGYRVETTKDYERNYVSMMFYDAEDNFIGYADVLEFYHRVPSGGYAWATVVYTWSTEEFTIPFTIEMRATDSGMHTLNIESWEI